MNMLSYQHITIDCESFMCLTRGSLIPCKHTDGTKAWHDIVSTSKDQMAFMLNDKCIGDEFFFFFFLWMTPGCLILLKERDLNNKLIV